jgi:hypothetical protein
MDVSAPSNPSPQHTQIDTARQIVPGVIEGTALSRSQGVEFSDDFFAALEE